MKEELHNLDILDASFPCSVFSIAGDRQKAWGKEKVFREGQKAQRLDDLAFYSIDLAKELKPKVVVFENVQGLLQGEAIEYVKEIYKQMDNAGYILQHWLLNARNMGVPQNRPRVFFLGLRKDLCEPFMVQKDLFERVPKIDMDFNEKEIVLDEFSDLNKGRRIINGKRLEDVWDFDRVPSDKLVHQNEKPIPLLMQCILKSSDEGDLVFDGCMFGKFRAWDCLDSMEIVYRSVGSLGGGNHFIELDANEEGEKFLVIHTGSRNLGVRVCNYYQKLAYEYCRKKIADKSEVIAKLKSEGRENEIQSVIKSLGTKNISKELSYLEGDLLNDYLNDMRIVQKYAERNRMIIANRLVNALGVDIDANSDKYSFTTIHNYIDTDKGILRKGAISAKKDEVVIIPMNMRDGSLICKGKGNKDWLCSAPHGAGRLMSRTQAKKELSMDSYKNEMNGIYSTSVCEETIDEAPMAYKPTEEIVELIKPTVDVIDVIKPIYNFKAKL